MSPTPNYKNPTSTQTLQAGLDEYYRVNPHITDPTTQPPEFAKILIAHDVGHVIYGCDTGMHDELKLLPLSWWTSECTFKEYLGMKNTPAVDGITPRAYGNNFLRSRYIPQAIEVTLRRLT